MKTKKVRRNSGRVYPKIVKGFTKQDIIEQGIEPQPEWNDWADYRDGFRYDKDRTHIRSKHMSWSNEELDKQNRKLLKQAKIRRKRKTI